MYGHKIKYITNTYSRHPSSIELQTIRAEADPGRGGGKSGNCPPPNLICHPFAPRLSSPYISHNFGLLCPPPNPRARSHPGYASAPIRHHGVIVPPSGPSLSGHVGTVVRNVLCQCHLAIRCRWSCHCNVGLPD